MGQPWSHGAATGQPWGSHGAAMGQPWSSHGAAMEQPWGSHGAAMEQGSAQVARWVGHRVDTGECRDGPDLAAGLVLPDLT